ncbi:histidine kinase [Hymenobacter busanensis]|uniref:Histidine kinase n=1 Tax=Hymenobacter busanensis TaxID=2607656 RepID=A0A7L5A1X8_9BACT|nr:histidine kinase [Hymenobacter busanensis]KAA9327057.1 histidine kinase [Hymenobacter busanensis]QHJ09508.1 histidine kinase [Hymenobacter busanensis]
MNDRRFRLLGIPLLSLLIVLLSGAEQLHSWPDFLVSWGISLLFTTVLWVGTLALWSTLRQRFPDVRQTARRLWWVALATVLYTAVGTTALTALLQLAMPQYFSLRPWRLLSQIEFNLIPAVFVLLVYESRYFFEQWTLNVRRAEQLARAHERAQLEALQQQLDPHFLFNTLNTLSALIEPGNEPAQQFVEQLADVYRYVLLSRERPTVPLREELAFVEAYVALQKARLRDNLQVHVAVPAALLDQHIAPLSVQLLIENALKHNEASRQHPLHVQVGATADGWLRVRNARRARGLSLNPSTGLGLRNIRERYALLAPAQPVQVHASDHEFAVQLPLLPAATLPGTRTAVANPYSLTT